MYVIFLINIEYKLDLVFKVQRKREDKLPNIRFIVLSNFLKVAIQRIVVNCSALHVALCVDDFIVRVAVSCLVEWYV